MGENRRYGWVGGVDGWVKEEVMNKDGRRQVRKEVAGKERM